MAVDSAVAPAAAVDSAVAPVAAAASMAVGAAVAASMVVAVVDPTVAVADIGKTQRISDKGPAA